MIISRLIVGMIMISTGYFLGTIMINDISELRLWYSPLLFFPSILLPAGGLVLTVQGLFKTRKPQHFEVSVID